MAGGSTITGYRIHGLDDVQDPLAGLGNSYFEVEVPLGPVAGAYTNLRLRGARLLEWIAASPSNQSDWNNQKNPYKIPQNRADRDTIPLDSLCLLTVANYTNPAAGEPKGDILLYTDYQAGVTFKVHRDGRFDGTLADAQWYPIDSPEAGVPNWKQLQPDGVTPTYAFAVGDFIRAAIAPSTTQFFFSAKVAGVLPAPTAQAGDANWMSEARENAPTTTRVAWENIVGDTADSVALTAAFDKKADLLAGRVPSIQLQGTYRGNFTASTSYARNDLVLFQAQNYYAKAAFTSGPSFNAADWTAFAPAGVNRLLNYGSEIKNPPTYDTGTAAYNFQCANNTNYLLTAGGVAEMFLPTLINTGFFVGLRLGVAASAPLALTAHGDGSAADYVVTLQPGEIAVLEFLKPNDVVSNSAATTGQWLLAFRSMPERASGDIEITDPTKGIIMTVGSTRVRAKISGTAGARTWTFTDL